jgi:hypothetical protein
LIQREDILRENVQADEKPLLQPGTLPGRHTASLNREGRRKIS